MKNYITLFILFLLGWGIIVAQESKEKVLNQLQQTIEQSATYIKAKEQRIASLEKELKKNTSAEEKYNIHKQLYAEYQKFKVEFGSELFAKERTNSSYAERYRKTRRNTYILIKTILG